MTKIKLCGLKRSEDIHAAVALRPDYVGFVFAGGKRCVSAREAQALRTLLPTHCRAVGVFVNEPLDSLLQTVHLAQLDVLQLHGAEDEPYIQAARRALADAPIQLWKAVRVQSAKDVRQAATLSVDALLLDACIPGEMGGSGVCFDWSLLEGLDKAWMRQHCFLAGGLTPSNVAEAIERVHPLGVDVSSGIETKGCKDPAKMRAFVEAVRRADQRRHHEA